MRRLPVMAIMLGLSGLLPFVACTAAILFFSAQVPVPRLVMVLIDYAAVILAFLGAVHWGLAISASPHEAATRPGFNRARLALGVLPALLGWAALLVALVASPLISIGLLILGFLLTVSVESRAGRLGLIPPGYLTLRWILTLVVVTCLAASLLARLV